MHRGIAASPDMQPNSELVLRFLKPIFYRHVDRPESTIIRDLAYVDGGSDRQTLDLYLPDEDVDGWPVLVFVHGGGWDGGDRKLEVAGEDVYGNIGRYYAEAGLGCAVISYRLLPDVHWREQFEDVANAVAWVQGNAGSRGGDVERTILIGHSAGAHLSARVALETNLLVSAGGRPEYVRGVICASGAGFDMVDETTYQLGANIEYLRNRFGQFETPADWQYEASVVQFVQSDPPPFLIMYGSLEDPGYGRQADVLATALRRAGGNAEVIGVPGQTHRRMVPALSKKGGLVADSILRFARRVAEPQAE